MFSRFIKTEIFREIIVSPWVRKMAATLFSIAKKGKERAMIVKYDSAFCITASSASPKRMVRIEPRRISTTIEIAVATMAET